jgi:hypothetical protein
MQTALKSPDTAGVYEKPAPKVRPNLEHWAPDLLQMLQKARGAELKQKRKLNVEVICAGMLPEALIGEASLHYTCTASRLATSWISVRHWHSLAASGQQGFSQAALVRLGLWRWRADNLFEAFE